MNASTFDRAGVAISALCIIHCLFLPMVTTVLPLFALIAENEDIHKILIVLAVLPALIAFAPSLPLKAGGVIRGAGCLGVLCLIFGAFAEPLHDYEKYLTVLGAFCLAFAHVYRMFVYRHHRHKN